MNDVRVIFRLPKDMKAQLDAIAKRNQLKVSELIRILLKDGIEKIVAKQAA